VQFHAKDLAYGLGETNYWNYIYHNGPNSLFNGYMWSLDVFVDYAWAQLGTLNNVLVVLLIVEVRRHKQVLHLSENENMCAESCCVLVLADNQSGAGCDNERPATTTGVGQ
jgi:hypothetical protein